MRALEGTLAPPCPCTMWALRRAGGPARRKAETGGGQPHPQERRAASGAEPFRPRTNRPLMRGTLRLPGPRAPSSTAYALRSVRAAPGRVRIRYSIGRERGFRPYTIAVFTVPRTVLASVGACSCRPDGSHRLGRQTLTNSTHPGSRAIFCTCPRWLMDTTQNATCVSS